jgi:hypothetical protein
MSETEDAVVVDESKYEGMPRTLGAAHRRRDVATQKLANLEKRKKVAREKLDKVLAALDEKRPTLVSTIARSTVQINAYHAQEAAVQLELDRLNEAPQADSPIESDDDF